MNEIGIYRCCGAGWRWYVFRLDRPLKLSKLHCRRKQEALSLAEASLYDEAVYLLRVNGVPQGEKKKERRAD